MVASLVGVITNVIFITNNFSYALKIVSHTILALLCLAILVVGTMTLLIYNYKIENGFLVKRVGVFKEVIDLSKVVSICKYSDLKNLVLYDEKSYAIITINEYDFDKFVSSIREVNASIRYEIKTKD
jgi:hypothetical protein